MNFCDSFLPTTTHNMFQSKGANKQTFCKHSKHASKISLLCMLLRAFLGMTELFCLAITFLKRMAEFIINLFGVIGINFWWEHAKNSTIFPHWLPLFGHVSILLPKLYFLAKTNPSDMNWLSMDFAKLSCTLFLKMMFEIGSSNCGLNSMWL